MIGYCMRPQPPLLLSPEEVVHLFTHYGSIDTARYADDIARAWCNRDKEFLPLDGVADYQLMLAAIFEAGRIQGMREVRKRRHGHYVGHL